MKFCAGFRVDYAHPETGDNLNGHWLSCDFPDFGSFQTYFEDKYNLYSSKGDETYFKGRFQEYPKGEYTWESNSFDYVANKVIEKLKQKR